MVGQVFEFKCRYSVHLADLIGRQILRIQLQKFVNGSQNKFVALGVVEEELVADLFGFVFCLQLGKKKLRIRQNFLKIQH